MNRESTLSLIKVMRHFAAGGEVEESEYDGKWKPTGSPKWNWIGLNYRISPKAFKPPKKSRAKKVKLEAWLLDGEVRWHQKGTTTPDDITAKRIPELDEWVQIVG